MAPGTTGPNDHFIFVSDQLLASASAASPWSKSGTVAVAANKPFLASESQNTYISWYINGAQTNFPCSKSSSGSGAMEGTLDLIQAFGSVPSTLYLCAAAYITTNGGPLVAQAPSGSGPNIDPGEFLAIPTVCLRDFNADGTFDRLDPALDFTLQSIQRVSNGYAVNWLTMPGRAYQLIYRDNLLNAWSNLVPSLSTAAALQTMMSFTDAPPSANQRFYKVQLLP